MRHESWCIKINLSKSPLYLKPRINKKLVFFVYLQPNATFKISPMKWNWERCQFLQQPVLHLCSTYVSKYLVSICIVNRRLLESVISQRMMFVVYAKYYYYGGWGIATYWESGYFLVLYSIHNQHQRENIKSKYDWKRKLSQAINHVQYMKILLSKCHQNYKVWYLLYTKLWF